VEFGSGLAGVDATSAEHDRVPVFAYYVERLRGRRMSEDEKLRFILIVSAIVAALAVHRFIDTSHALAHSTGVHFIAPDEFGVGSD
jgi:hypothetical protein